jgi:galactokinase/mevalonate kinase-like predicted kinase
MTSESHSTQYLLTLPPRMAREFETLEERPRPQWFATCDPPGAHLGSGGGTANLLAEAWCGIGAHQSFPDWLHASRKLIIHGGGQSRRLPAYAPTGKLLMPIPVFRWARGQRLDQTLLDLQLPDYERVLAHAPRTTVAMVASGDVLLRFGRDLPAFPEVDVLGLGMWVKPQTAKDFGVFFCPRQRPNELAFFLQKPSPSRIRELAPEYFYLVDTGMWLLSERAVDVLMRRSGWRGEDFAQGTAEPYEFYAQFGLALGTAPTEHDRSVNALTCAVLPLPEAEFYHFGTSRQLIESTSELQNLVLDETKLGLTGARRHPDVYHQNTRFDFALRLERNHTVWIENSVIPESWQLASEHVLTGVPENSWDLRLEPGVCLDFVPVGAEDWCVRPYGMGDAFRGALQDPDTRWFGTPVADWLANRKLAWSDAGLDPRMDVQRAPLFPVLTPAALEPRFLEWLSARQPAERPDFAEFWCTAPRLAAPEICEQVNLSRLYGQRASLRQACLWPMLRNSRWSVFFRLDLESTARLYAASEHPLPEIESSAGDDLEPLHAVHAEMFLSAVLRHRGRAGWERHEDNAFTLLREMLVREAQLSPAIPARAVLEDQIVWGRSPVRLDLAGGWSDTPPYCIEYGGKVINVAVDLNGQPPIQVFAKLCPRPEIVLRSIDLGVEERVHSWEELDTFSQAGSEFGLAKAALVLAGFSPRFHGRPAFGSLREQLQDFGGGLEVSMLCAVPKGSGLGTSSILAATLLGTIGDLCGLDWDRTALFTRTLALEQLLTTGGGWQDQAGGLFRGIKLVETGPGQSQKPALRWLPDTLFGRDYANKTLLLYYTGLTRLAKNILREIVRGIFLNSPSHLRTIEEIGANAARAGDALQRCDYLELTRVIEQSWRLNQQLDAGTNTPEVQSILDSVKPHLAAAKLLGAGGGGYLLMFARDEDAAREIRRTLLAHPPNAGARFVDFSLSETGLQVTRS